MKTAVDNILRKEQAGFRKGKGCSDNIFILRNIIEQCTEWQRQLVINFIDFEKAFDSLHRDSIWKILRNYGIPSKIVNTIKLFYEEFRCTVGETADTSFFVKSGVRQGCVMSSLLFITAIDWVMKRTVQNSNTGIRWTLLSNLEDIDYADDLALFSHTEHHMQSKTSDLQRNSSLLGLKINIRKTELLSLNTREPPNIELNGQPISCTSSFTYLGSIVTSDGGAEQEVKTRLGKARSAFQRLRNIWKSTSISRHTKVKIYNSCVISVLLYGAECWRMTERDLQKLSGFHNICLRKIMRVFWPRKITNEDLHKALKCTDMETILLRRRWGWLGHVLRKPSDDMTKVALKWTPEGKRRRGRPKTTWRRTMESEIKERGFSWGTIERTAKNREEWRSLVLALCATRHNKD